MATRKAPPRTKKKVAAAKAGKEVALKAPAKKRAKVATAQSQPDAAPRDTIGEEILADPAFSAAMIADAAYFRAQQRGFEPGKELDDWLAAEAEVAEQLSRAVKPRARRQPAAEA